MPKYVTVKNVVEVNEECPFCGKVMVYHGTGISTYGTVDIWNCKEHGDTWIGAGKLVNLGLTLA